MKMRTALTICLLTLPGLVLAQEEPLESMEQRASYALGFNVARQLTSQGLPLQVDLLLAGFEDGVRGSEGRMNREELGQALQELQQLQADVLAETNARNRQRGEEFLRSNATREGVKTLATGLQYEILSRGEGPSPAAGDAVTVHYRGTLIDGTVFDSSYDRGEPVTIGLDQVIAGWQQALPLMKTGGKWKLFVPADLAYGPQGTGGVIGPGATLIFEVELLAVTPAEES